MASRHPIFNFYLIQWNIYKRSYDPSYQHLKPNMSERCYVYCCGQVWRRFSESMKSYGCFHADFMQIRLSLKKFQISCSYRSKVRTEKSRKWNTRRASQNSEKKDHCKSEGIFNGYK